MPFTRRQEERWCTAVLRHFPPSLAKVRKQHDAGTAVGPRTYIQEPGALRSSYRPRSATVPLESKRHRCRTAIVLRRLAMSELSVPVRLDWYSKFSEGQSTPLRIVLPNVRAKRAPTAWRAGQQAQNGPKAQRLMASVTCRWRSA